MNDLGPDGGGLDDRFVLWIALVAVVMLAAAVYALAQWF